MTAWVCGETWSLPGSNMKTDLAKAKQAMDSADTDRARHYLDLAHHEVEKLEAFLGHR